MRIKLRKTDTIFSQYIRSRDDWKCRRCGHQHEAGNQGLHNSHYFSRRHEATRFDPENCIALCFPCHHHWGHGEGRPEYEKYMRSLLGTKRYNALEVRANTIQKRDDRITLLYIKKLLEEV